MFFECFYYPTLNEHNEVERCNKGIMEFEFGDVVPTKTLYYNYGKSFAIFKGAEFYIVEDNVLTKAVGPDELRFPLRIVFNKGTQLTIFSKKELSSIRLLLKGEKEREKELGELFFLSVLLNRKIKNIQYRIMSELNNSLRDSNYVNSEIDKQTKVLLEDLKTVECKFYKMLLEHPDLKDDYLTYMNFSNKENFFDISINKFFKPGTEQHDEYLLKSSVWKKKPFYPKFKLDNLYNYSNYAMNELA